jgi:hypothetical protein
MPEAGYEQHRDAVRKRLRRPGPPKERRRVTGGEVIDLVDDDERCDPEFENDEADRRRDAFAADRGSRLEQRCRQRALLTLGNRLDLSLRLLGLHVGGSRARPIAASRGGGDHPSKILANPDGLPDEVERHWTLIRNHVEAIEEILDSQDGLLREEPPEAQGMYGSPGYVRAIGNHRFLRGEEKDKIVFDCFQGVRAGEVAEEFPQLGGHARTIERARKAEADRRKLRVRLVDGVVLGPREEKKAA